MAKLVNKKHDIALLIDLSLVDASFELNKVKDGEKELNFVKELLEKETELVTALTDSNLREQEKNELIDNIFKGNVSDQMIDLLKKLFIRYTDIIAVTAITVVPMSESYQKKLKNVLSKKLDKDIILENQIDKTIIGGVLLKVGDKVIDGTLGGQLKSIRRTLKETSL